jgi:hypothetical protein
LAVIFLILLVVYLPTLSVAQTVVVLAPNYSISTVCGIEQTKTQFLKREMKQQKGILFLISVESLLSLMIDI